jgi:hypothetical protein
MATLKRVGPGSAFKVGFAVYGILGLILGVIFALISLLGGPLLGGAFPPGAQPGVFRMFFGIGAVIMFPVCYGIIGGIGAVILALLYNLVAGWMGGLEVDIS